MLLEHIFYGKLLTKLFLEQENLIIRLWPSVKIPPSMQPPYFRQYLSIGFDAEGGREVFTSQLSQVICLHSLVGVVKGLGPSAETRAPKC